MAVDAIQPVGSPYLPAPSSAVEQVATRSSGAAGERLAGLEILRVLAVAATVWFHARGPGSGYMVGRLVCLLLMSVALPLYRPATCSFSAFAAGRARRLLIPWLFWCAVYGVWTLCGDLYHHDPIAGDFNWGMLLAGTCAHLWYLPFAFIASVCANRLRHWTRQVPPGLLCKACVAAGCVALMASSQVWREPWLPFPLGNYLLGIPAIPLGLAAATARRHGTHGRVWLARTVAAVVGLYLAFVIGELYHPPADHGFATTMFASGGLLLRYAMGVPLFCAAFLWDARMPRALVGFSSVAFGVYLIHPLVITILVNLHVMHREIATSGQALAVFAISCLAVLPILRTPLRRFV